MQVNSGGTRNTGIDCLKIIMCFVVVLCHCWNPEQSFKMAVKLIYPILNLAVPVFFLISFILCGQLFSSTGSKTRIQERLKRLSLPHLFWAVLGFLALNAASLITGNPKMSISRLWCQLLGGHVYDRPMWFQVDLILLTAWFYLTERFSDKNVFLYAQILIAFALQYTGVNHSIFCNFPDEIKFTLGRITEVIPYCATGIILYKKRFLKVLERHRVSASAACVAVIACHYLLKIKFNAGSFQYAGIDLYLTSLSTVILFWLLPFNKLPLFVRRILQWLSGYTLGIYCMHALLPELGVPKGNLAECVCIYAICLAVSFLISLIPCRTIKMAVK